MGTSVSKSPQERRNTVLKRSQRKTIHGVKARALKLIKDIKKYGDSEENCKELDSRLSYLLRELERIEKNLQPQLRIIDSETRKTLREAQDLLEEKKRSIQETGNNNDAIHEEQNKSIEEQTIKEEDEEELEEQPQLNQNRRDLSASKKSLMELKIVKVEPDRSSVQKLGVPVLPGAILNEMHRKTSLQKEDNIAKVAGIRSTLGYLEDEISKFLGPANGKYYNRLKERLDKCELQLKEITDDDEDVREQVKLCLNYVHSCITFLDERAVVGGEAPEEEVLDEVFTPPPTTKTPYKATFV